MGTFIDRLERFRGDHPAVAALIAINVVVSLLIWAISIAGWIFSFDTGFTVSLLSLPAGIPDLLSRPWTPLSYMVTHYSPLHLLFNMLWLYWFARLIDALTPRRLLLLYIGGGLFGAAAFMLAGWLTGVPSGTTLCGASAAVMALMTAAAVADPNRRISLLLFGSVRLKWIAVAAILLSFLGMGGGNAGGQYAHIGGVLFGLCASPLILRKSNDSSRPSRADSPRRPRTQPTPEGIASVARASEGRLSDPERLDQLLDKIRLSGFESLTPAEKGELMAISSRLK